MAKYKILWVDDDWVGENSPKLKALTNEICNTFSSNGIELDINTEEKVSNGVVEIGNSEQDYRLVIVDLVFKNHRYQVEPLLSRLSDLQMPHIIFTNFLDITDKKNANSYENNYVVDKIEKGPSGNKLLINSLLQFFSTLPVRILQLSDLHYDSNFEHVNKEEQDYLFESLLDTIKNENNFKKFDLVAICGDISMNSPAEDLLEARGIVKEIAKCTVKDLARLAIVPGNHDILWDDFEGKKPSGRPFQPYLDFYSAIYENNLEILSELGAWDDDNHLLNSNAISSHLSWHRRLPSSNLSVIGISTPSTELNLQGHGNFLREHKEFIKQKFAPKNNSQFRIALMHHNIHSALSYSRQGVRRNLKNSGEALYSMVSTNCACVLSGHIHSVNYIRSNASRLGSNGFSNLSSVDVVSGGTTGGIHKANDRSRSFNIIEYSHCKSEHVGRSLTITPYFYEGDEHTWIKQQKLIVEGDSIF